jgi:preprotein translocase subunit SecE
MDNRKIIVASYVGASIILWYLTRQGLQGLYVGLYQVRRLPGIALIREFLPVIVGLATFFILLLNTKVGSFLDEVVLELKKVTWPSREDVVKSTAVVLVCVLFASCVLAVFDIAFGRVIGYFLHS